MRLVKHLLNVAKFTQLPRDNRRIVFYSEGKPSWVHLDRLLKRLLDVGETAICYITSDREDPGLELQHDKLRHFLIDHGWFRNWFFENLDADILVMTMPDLDRYQVKRSKHKVHYVYVQHSLVSQHMAYRTGAFDHFDTIFCAGPHHVRELRALEEQRQTSRKHLFEHGYQRLEAILDDHQTIEKNDDEIHVLIAPSWGDNAIVETVGLELIGALLDQAYRVTLRPHPQTLRHSAKAIAEIQKRWDNNPLFRLDTDVTSNNSLLASNLMISDWSGAASDYAFGLGKPVLFIDVPRKVNNPDYQELDIEPFESAIRTEIGAVVSPLEIGNIADSITALLNKFSGPNSLQQVAREHIYNLGHSDSSGAEEIMRLLAETEQ